MDIPSLILKAMKEDVDVYVERERFSICWMKCFNRLVRYQNALRKVEEISFEIQKDYQSDDSVHVKRLAKEPGRMPEAKKSLKLGDTSSASATSENSQHSQVQDVGPAAAAAALTPRIVVTSFDRPPVFSFGSVSLIPWIQNQHV